MRVLQLVARSDPDGVIRLSIPAEPGGDYDVTVVLTAKTATDGPQPAKTPEELGWPPGFFESTYGSITDDSFVRPPQPFPLREISLE